MKPISVLSNIVPSGMNNFIAQSLRPNRITNLVKPSRPTIFWVFHWLMLHWQWQNFVGLQLKTNVYNLAAENYIPLFWLRTVLWSRPRADLTSENLTPFWRTHCLSSLMWEDRLLNIFTAWFCKDRVTPFLNRVRSVVDFDWDWI